MKKFLFALVLLSACGPADLSKTAAEEIKETDRAMCKTATEIGFNHALLHYAGDGFVKFNDGKLPFIGKLAFSEEILAKKDITTITWEPEDAEAAKSGDVGYSWGYWKFVKPDTTYYGTYFTGWKKTEKGTWAMMLDGGNDTPKPNQ